MIIKLKENGKFIQQYKLICMNTKSDRIDVMMGSMMGRRILTFFAVIAIIEMRNSIEPKDICKKIWIFIIF